jgi:hypothetical protein
LLAISVILITISFQVIFKYSDQAVENLCVLIGLTVFGLLGQDSGAVIEAVKNKQINMHEAFILIPVILGIVAYKVAKRFLCMGKYKISSSA